jgi:carbamoyl-phosphate synthase small subunit
MTRGSPGALVLADGTVFRGTAVGASGIATGEVVFNTSMTGYQEIATDPSYARQIVTLTSTHIGNYGTNAADDQARRVFATGIVTRSMTAKPSSWRAQESFPEWLEANGIVALSDVDTRRLTRHIRTHGAMPGVIATDGTEEELGDLAKAAPAMEGLDLASAVSTPDAYSVEAVGAARATVVAIDLGIKHRIIDELIGRGLETHVVPSDSTPEQILSYGPQGLFLSNGPGDPEPLDHVVNTLRSLLGKFPVFGICLGHQVLGLALGATTYKLPFGHHGGNHPVKRVADSRVQITAQNHGFAVRPPGDGVGPFDSDFGPVEVTHVNLNDNTVEGLACSEATAVSVQYHPEAAPGPNDARELFDDFAAAVMRGS